jgi:hypothetical protein
MELRIATNCYSLGAWFEILQAKLKYLKSFRVFVFRLFKWRWSGLGNDGFSWAPSVQWLTY